MVDKFVLAVLLICLSVEAYQLNNRDLIKDLLEEVTGVSDETFAKIFADDKANNDLNPLTNDEDENENFDVANEVDLESYEDESPELMDDDETEGMDETALQTKLKDPLWRRFRFRSPRIRIRVPRVRLPRIRLPRVRLPRIRLPRIRLPRIRIPRIRFRRIRLRLRRLNPKSFFKKLISKFYKEKQKNPCPYSEETVQARVDAMKCPAHWKSFFTNIETANELIDSEYMVSYCQVYTLCKACAPSSPWNGAQCEVKLNKQIQMFCNGISTGDDGTINVEVLTWCQDRAKKIISYERSQAHSHNADLCVCGLGEVGKP